MDRSDFCPPDSSISAMTKERILDQLDFHWSSSLLRIWMEIPSSMLLSFSYILFLAMAITATIRISFSGIYVGFPFSSLQVACSTVRRNRG